MGDLNGFEGSAGENVCRFHVTENRDLWPAVVDTIMDRRFS
jgi:hypothetical protein